MFCEPFCVVLVLCVLDWGYSIYGYELFVALCVGDTDCCDDVLSSIVWLVLKRGSWVSECCQQVSDTKDKTEWQV